MLGHLDAKAGPFRMFVGSEVECKVRLLVPPIVLSHAFCCVFDFRLITGKSTRK